MFTSTSKMNIIIFFVSPEPLLPGRLDYLYICVRGASLSLAHVCRIAQFYTWEEGEQKMPKRCLYVLHSVLYKIISDCTLALWKMYINHWSISWDFDSRML